MSTLDAAAEQRKAQNPGSPKANDPGSQVVLGNRISPLNFAWPLCIPVLSCTLLLNLVAKFSFALTIR